MNKYPPIIRNDNPRIYAYTDDAYKGFIKIGYTTVDVEKRIWDQYPTKRPTELPFKIIFNEPALRNDGSPFTDKDIHKLLEKHGFERANNSEWFKVQINDLRKAYNAIRDRQTELSERVNFPLRKEQQNAIEKTIEYFSQNKSKKFLWNAKMRFGKTFTSYQLCKQLKYKKVLIITFKPAVSAGWEDDLKQHVDFKDWIYYSAADPDFNSDKFEMQFKPKVLFISFQDLLGKDSFGDFKPKNKWMKTFDWDLVIFDEFHFGSWRKNAQELFAEKTEKDSDDLSFEDVDINELEEKIKSKHFLYLSGTPFRALANGEFIEEQIFNWTYIDEQREKTNWNSKDENPYSSLPQMVMMTYKVPDSIAMSITKTGSFDEFSLNEFFRAEGIGDEARFVYKDFVQKWLNLIRGDFLQEFILGNGQKFGNKRIPMPFSDTHLFKYLSHTFWYLPNVASCFAMKNLLTENQNSFFKDYKIIVAAGVKAGNGVKALQPVREAMHDSQNTKSITISCGKLTTGVTVPQWSGVFMLRDLKSPESYFQTVFRAQSPWVIRDEMYNKLIMKDKCYIFDFAPNRTLNLLLNYANGLSHDSKDPNSNRKKIDELLDFMPILAADEHGMHEIDATGVMDMAISGQTATLLARRWNSADLVNVDNETLKRLIGNDELMSILDKVEGFRNLNQEISKVIAASEKIKMLKSKGANGTLTESEKKTLSLEEKERVNLRKKIQEKLIKFATRIPVFMYLTDYREESLVDIITKLEPALFKRVTGLTIDDFETLVSLNVFNKSQMNDAIFKFKSYEDASLEYIGTPKNISSKVGGFNTTISREIYDDVYKK